MNRVLLVRHGNTFSAGDKVVWVGARTDLSLTLEGQQQAAQLGQHLKQLQIKPELIACGPLKRTCEHATILKNILDNTQTIEVINDLREIDYGAWEGLSSAEIELLGSQKELKQWSEQSIWPSTPGWSPQASDIEISCGKILAGIIQKYASSTIILISSNGILRFFANHASNQHDFDDLKMKTGHIAEMLHDGRKWLISSWDQAPLSFTSEWPQNT
jgi:broad specificity phosphatase PhoE